ncbi:MAG: GDP-L-fucose synthase [Elusimicrobia bacterium]|nr:GDP-L-fucose synthase [Elusimicrobiota bacterium]
MGNKTVTYVAGHTGLVGSALYRRLSTDNNRKLVAADVGELDLRRQADTEVFMARHKPEQVFIAAARVGGILANNTYKAEFIYDNLAIAMNVIHAAYRNGVKKLLNLGSSCIYPKLAPQPMREDALLAGALEPTNEPYAVAKITALKLCRYYNEQYGTNYISVMPTNMYGPGDNYNLETAHVLPAMLRKFHLAKLLAEGDMPGVKKDLASRPVGFGLDAKLRGACDKEVTEVLAGLGVTAAAVKLWGTGSVYREFLYVDDMADACAFLMDSCDYKDIGEVVNIGTGVDIQLKDLAALIRGAVGFAGAIDYDRSKPDGTPKKLLDVSRMAALGWKARVSLQEGVRREYERYTGKTVDREAVQP